MNRLLTLALLAVCASSCFAQSVAIREPKEGAKIREITKVRIPARGLPANSYIGIVVNGKFVEAISPEVEKGDFVYNLDTRRLGLKDGPATLEAVVYMDSDISTSPAQVVARTGVNVTVDNSASISVPKEGLDLSYHYRRDSEFKYDIVADTTMATLSQAQVQLGRKGFQSPVNHDSFRFLQAVDNVYTNGDGMVRIVPLPDKGRSYAFVPLASEGNTVRKVYQNEMEPVYLRLTNKGRESFGARPPYFGIDGINGQSTSFDVFLRLPIPVLPTGPRTVGSTWQGAFAMPTRVDSMAGKFTDLIPGNGHFDAVEYKHGIPCAKVRTTVSLGAKDLTKLNDLGLNSGENTKLTLESVCWLAIGGGYIVRQELNFIQEAVIDAGSAPAAGGSAAGGGGGNPPSMPPKGGKKGGGGAGAPTLGSITDGSGGHASFDPHTDKDGHLSLFTVQNGPFDPPQNGQQDGGGQDGSPRGGPPSFGPSGPPAGFNGQFGGLKQGGKQTSTNAAKQILRVTLAAVIELED